MPQVSITYNKLLETEYINTILYCIIIIIKGLYIWMNCKPFNL